MKVRMIDLWASPEGVFYPGSEVDLDPAQALDLVAKGHAAAIDEPVIETTLAQAPAQVETTMLARNKGKLRR